MIFNRCISHLKNLPKGKSSHYIFIDLIILGTLSMIDGHKPNGNTGCQKNVDYYNSIEMVNLSRFLSAIMNCTLEDIESLKAEQVQQLNFDLITSPFGNQFTKAEIIRIYKYLQNLKVDFQKIVDSDIDHIRNPILNS